MKFWNRVKVVDAFLSVTLFLLYSISLECIGNAITPISSFSDLVIVTAFCGTLGGALLLVAYLFFRKNRDTLKAQSKAFRSRMKFCYACGFELEAAQEDRLCPSCQVTLTFQDLLDEPTKNMTSRS